MLKGYESAGWRKSRGDKAGKRSPVFVETLNEIWNLNHCYARIRIISVYCMFLLKRSNHYRTEINRVTTVEFVHEQFREMVGYKEQIVEIERQAFEETNQVNRNLREEIKRLTEKLKADIEHRFLIVAKKVGEKIPGETVANGLEMVEAEVEAPLAEGYEMLRPW